MTDATGAPVAQARVSASSPALLGGPRHVIAGARGDYRFADLAPGTYRIQAVVDGFKAAIRTDVQLAADSTIVVDLDLELASLSEAVSVLAVSPLVSVTSAESPHRLTAELIANLPTSRVLSDVMNLLPGVNANIGLGGVQSSNPLFIDGVNTADAMALLPWASFNYNWVEDVQVVGVGAGAEYGEFSGIIQKSRLKSGSNRFSGLGEYRTTRPNWVDTNTSSLPLTLQSNFAAQSERILDWRDTSVQLGGPVSLDRVWFFAGVQDSRTNVQPALYSGPSSTDTRNRRVLTKLDARAASLMLSGYYEHDRYHASGDGLGPFTPIEATTTNSQPNHNWRARVSRTVGARTTLEVDHAGATGLLSYNPTPPATRTGPYPHFDLVTGVSSGNTSFFQDIGSTRGTVGATMTAAITDGVTRSHAMKVGVQYEWTSTLWTSGVPGERFYLDSDGAPVLITFQAEDSQTVGTRRTTAYAEDEWAIGERLTLQPGVRVSFNRGVVSQGTVLSTSPVSPRIGVAWDVMPDHRTVVRAHYGRYHDAALTSQFAFADDQPSQPEITAQVSGDQLVEISRSTTPHFELDAGISQGFFDQWVAGVEREVWRSTSVTLQYIRRDYRNLVGFLDLGSVYEPAVRTDPGPDNRLGTADDGGEVTVFRKTNSGGELYYFTNPEGVHRRYSAVQLIGRKQYGGAWQMQGSYSWSSTRGNAVNGLRSNSGGPDLGFNGVTADPNRAINADGPVPWDFTHEVKVLSTWRIPVWGGVNVSGVYQFHTGSAWGRAVQFPNLFVTFGVRIEPRGTRRTEALNTLDLRIEKTFPVVRSSRLGVFADVFNLGNQGIPDPSARRPVFEISGPSFGQPQFWLSPRTLRAGLRLSF